MHIKYALFDLSVHFFLNWNNGDDEPTEYYIADSSSLSMHTYIHNNNNANMQRKFKIKNNLQSWLVDCGIKKWDKEIHKEHYGPEVKKML